jgi:ribokinase
MPEAPPHIVVVGSTNVDLTFRTIRLPKAGETLTGHGFHLGHGGKGANQAVMAARLGARVTMVSRVGKDVFGDDALENYRTHHVDTGFVQRDETVATGVASIVVDDEAHNCILVVPGANAALTPQLVREARPAIREARAVICQLEVPVDTTLEAFRLAKSAGVQTVLNPAPAVPLPDELLRLTDFCVPNETELALLTSQSVATLTEVEQAARILATRGPATVIATLGARGVLIVDSGVATHLPAVPVKAVDPTGAGDAFIGSLAVFLAEGRTLAESARRANAAAALAVTKLGAQTAFPMRAEVETLLEEGGQPDARPSDRGTLAPE